MDLVLPRYDEVAPDENLIANWLNAEHHFSVVMLLARSVKHPQELMLVLTKRTDHLRTHSGQIGMPGGRVNRDDCGPIGTAFRETFEELGIPPEALHFHGYLDSAKTLHGGTLVPCVASTEIMIEDFVLNPEEVASLVVAPWHCYERERSKAVRFNYFGNWRNSISFTIDHHLVWGLTAGIIHRANLRKN